MTDQIKRFVDVQVITADEEFSDYIPIEGLPDGVERIYDLDIIPDNLIISDSTIMGG